MSVKSPSGAPTKKMGLDENGIPLLHKKPLWHFERVLVFLAYRNVFTEEEMSLHDPCGKLTSQAIKRVQSEIPSRKHLTPNTTPERVRQVLTTLFTNGEFRCGSAIRAAYSDITDHQIWTGDPSIKHLIPSCPCPIREGEIFDPVAIEKRQKMEIELGVELRDDKLPLEPTSSRPRRSLRLKNREQDLSSERRVSRDPPEGRVSRASPVRPISKDTIECVAKFQDVVIILDDKEPISQVHLRSSAPDTPPCIRNVPAAVDPPALRSVEEFQNQNSLLSLISRTPSPVAESPIQIPPDARRPRSSRPTRAGREARRRSRPDCLSTEQYDKSSMLPFRIQHTLLSTVQRLLEGALFCFAEEWLPDLLRERRWKVPEQGELNKWGEAFKMHIDSGRAVRFYDANMKENLVHVAQIRHAAVHRLPITNTTIRNEMLPQALGVAVGVGDDVRHQKILDIQRSFSAGPEGILDLQSLQETLGMSVESYSNEPKQRSSFSKRHRGTDDYEPPTKKAKLGDSLQEPLLIDDDEEFEIEKILESRLIYGKLQYRVSWTGYPEDPKFYPAANFKNAPDQIKEFHDTCADMSNVGPQGFTAINVKNTLQVLEAHSNLGAAEEVNELVLQASPRDLQTSEPTTNDAKWDEGGLYKGLLAALGT